MDVQHTYVKPSVDVYLDPIFFHKSYIKTNADCIMGNTFIIREFLFQAEAGAQAEEGTNPPPTKRLRSDELTRVIVISPDGRRHQLDISRESTLMVSDVNKEFKWSFLSPSICH